MSETRGTPAAREARATPQMRHTRIVATLGPSTSSPEAIAALVARGVDIFRLNFSHGTRESHAALIEGVRRASRAAHRFVSILQDLPGPKIRVGPMREPARLSAGDPIRLEHGSFEGSGGRIAVAYGGLFAAARRGDRLLLDDGRIDLEVREVSDGIIDARVVAGGTLSGGKGINVPGVTLPPASLTDRDVEALGVGAALGVDIVAISFVQSADDVRAARRALDAAGRPDVPVIAKIERPQAVEAIDDILAVAGGLMVARGDLGLEIPLERVPSVQKDLVRRARREGVPVIVATQVFDSMRTSPRPTRAEVSDAANAVEDGADAIMLSDETAAGAYPLDAVRILDAVIREAEAAPRQDMAAPLLNDPIFSRHGRALCEAAVTLARSGQADAIVAVTRAGKTARLLSAFRPTAPVFAATPGETTAARLSLLWGVTPLMCGDEWRGPAWHDDDPAAAIASIGRTLVERRLLPSGAVVVFVRVSAELGDARANFLHLRRIGVS